MPRLFLCSLFAVLLATAVVVAEPLTLELERAEVGFDQRTGEPIVTFRMKPDSRQAFAELTSRNVGRPLELRVDGRPLSKPIIREPILGGSGQISANLTADQARDIARRLQSGASKLEVEIVDR